MYRRRCPIDHRSTRQTHSKIAFVRQVESYVVHRVDTVNFACTEPRLKLEANGERRVADCVERNGGEMFAHQNTCRLRSGAEQAMEKRRAGTRYTDDDHGR